VIHNYTGHHILWGQAEVIGHGQQWKARKLHNAAQKKKKKKKKMKGGELVFSEPNSPKALIG
jgi:hypothetical protein